MGGFEMVDVGAGVWRSPQQASTRSSLRRFELILEKKIEINARNVI